MAMEVKRRRGFTRLSSRHQVTIPVEIVSGLGLRPGQTFRVEVRDGDVVLMPEEDLLARRRRALAELGGSLTGVYEPGYLDKLRSEWPE